MKGQCSKVVLFDNDGNVASKGPDSSVNLQWNSYWSQSIIPWDLQDDVYGFKVFAKTPLPAALPPNLGSECAITLFHKEWYMGTSQTVTSSNVMGKHWLLTGDWSGSSWKASGFCDTVVFFNNYNGKGCKLSNPKNKIFKSQTDIMRPDKFGMGKQDYWKPCGMLVYAKPPRMHTHTECPMRKKKTFDFSPQKSVITDSKITPQNTFCQVEAYDASSATTSQGKYSYFEKNPTDALVFKGKVEFKQQLQSSENLSKKCSSDSFCGSGGECKAKDTQISGVEEKLCFSKSVSPKSSGTIACSQCDAPCPKGTTKVMVERVDMGNIGSGVKSKSVNICGADPTTLRCHAVVNNKNWLTLGGGANTGVHSSSRSFEVTVGKGKVTVSTPSGGSTSGAIDLSFNCMKCVMPKSGPLRKTVRAYDRVVRTTDYIPFQGYSRIQLYPNPNSDAFSTSNTEGAWGFASVSRGKSQGNGLGAWCLDYWPDSGQTTSPGTNVGWGWGLFSAKCHETVEKNDNQLFALDPETDQLLVVHKDSPKPKCVTQLPRDDNGYFWPNDPKWVKDGYAYYLHGLYISVEDCLPVDTAQTASGGYLPRSGAGSSTTAAGPVSREGQRWRKVSQGGGRYKFQNMRSGLCLAQFTSQGYNYPSNCHTNSEAANACTNSYNGNPYGGYYGWNRSPPPGNSEAHLIVGTMNCGHDSVFSFFDRGDGEVRKGDEGNVMPGLTIQQKYQWQILSKEQQRMSKLLQIADSTKPREKNTNVLEHKDVTFFFKKGDNVHASSKFGCTVGEVQSCTKTSCSVKVGGNTQTVSLSELSPADQDWPRIDQVKKPTE
jgi:hypothetical protein